MNQPDVFSFPFKSKVCTRKKILEYESLRKCPQCFMFRIEKSLDIKMLAEDNKENSPMEVEKEQTKVRVISTPACVCPTYK